MGASTTKSGGGSGGNSSNNNRNRRSSNEGKKYVKKKLGLKTTVPSPISYMQDEKKTLAYNLKGKDRKFYGQEASKATDDYLVQTGKVKVGNYFKQVGGEFIRLDREEGEKLYAAGDPSISRSTIGDTRSKQIKYGQSDSAMGSGDPTGVMTSTAISKEMLQQQNKVKGILIGGLSLAAPSVGGTLMRMSAAKAGVDYAQPEAAYKDYMKGFEAKQKGEKYKSERNVQGVLGKAFNMLTGKRKKTDGKSKAGGTIIGGDNVEGLGN